MTEPKNLLSKLNIIKSKFSCSENKILDSFFRDEILKCVFDEKPIDKKKVDLFCLLKDIDKPVYDNKLDDLMHHKAIQTRALILDLISTDYSSDVKFIYKPEKWMYAIVDDIKKSLIKNPDFVTKYNNFLLKEFEDIFINNIQKYGSNGNQLLVNFLYYKKFMSKHVMIDFDQFLINIKNQINPNKLFKDAELEKIVADCNFN